MSCPCGMQCLSKALDGDICAELPLGSSWEPDVVLRDRGHECQFEVEVLNASTSRTEPYSQCVGVLRCPTSCLARRSRLAAADGEDGEDRASLEQSILEKLAIEAEARLPPGQRSSVGRVRLLHAPTQLCVEPLWSSHRCLQADLLQFMAKCRPHLSFDCVEVRAFASTSSLLRKLAAGSVKNSRTSASQPRVGGRWHVRELTK